MLVFQCDMVVNNQWEGETLWQRQLSKLLCKIVEYHSTQAHSWHLQCYWVSLAGSNLGRPCLSSFQVVQMVKCLLTMWETRVWSLGREDPLEKEMAPHSSTLAGKSHGLRSPVGYSPWHCKESDMTERLHFASVLASKILFHLLAPFKTFHFNLSIGELWNGGFSIY